MKPHRSACTQQRAWVSCSRWLFFSVLLGLPSFQAGPCSGMSGSEEAATRFLSRASGATRTDRYHTRIEIGSGEPASFQVPYAFLLSVFRDGRCVHAVYSPNGNRNMRRILNQSANADV